MSLRLSAKDAQRLGLVARTNKYGVSSKERRTYKGVVYDSRAEARRAAELDLLMTGKGPTLIAIIRQVRIPLGDDFASRVDFVVVRRLTDERGQIPWIQVEEVKGKETTDFRRVRELWPKYGPCVMRILKERPGYGWDVEELVPESMR